MSDNNDPKYTVTITSLKYEDRYKAKIIPVNNGYRLKLIEDDEEVGGGFFPVISDDLEDADNVFNDAEETANEWLNSKEAEADAEEKAKNKVKGNKNG